MLLDSQFVLLHWAIAWSSGYNGITWSLTVCSFLFFGSSSTRRRDIRSTVVLLVYYTLWNIIAVSISSLLQLTPHEVWLSVWEVPGSSASTCSVVVASAPLHFILICELLSWCRATASRVIVARPTKSFVRRHAVGSIHRSLASAGSVVLQSWWQVALRYVRLWAWRRRPGVSCLARILAQVWLAGMCCFSLGHVDLMQSLLPVDILPWACGIASHALVSTLGWPSTVVLVWTIPFSLWACLSRMLVVP